VGLSDLLASLERCPVPAWAAGLAVPSVVVGGGGVSVAGRGTVIPGAMAQLRTADAERSGEAVLGRAAIETLQPTFLGHVPDSTPALYEVVYGVGEEAQPALATEYVAALADVDAFAVLPIDTHVTPYASHVRVFCANVPPDAGVVLKLQLQGTTVLTAPAQPGMTLFYPQRRLDAGTYLLQCSSERIPSLQIAVSGSVEVEVGWSSSADDA
jgi:hypothetical protein